MKTYTGPTLAGGTLTVTCPPWCTHDHRIDERPDYADDTFHTGDGIALVPPADPYRNDEYATVPQLQAYLMQHSTDRATDAGPLIYLRLEDAGDRATELDVAAADALIRQLEEYTARLRVMRDQLARSLR